IIKKLGKLHGPTKTDGELLPATVNIQHIERQQSQIDLLLSQAIVVGTPDALKVEAIDRMRARSAPFHEKINSWNDWEFFASVVNYCEYNGIADLKFVSANHHEFGDPKEPKRDLHPHLKQRFQRVRIDYFAEM